MRSLWAILSGKGSKFRITRNICFGLILAMPIWIGFKIVKTKYFSLWGPTYIKDSFKMRYAANDEAKHFFFIMADHWEPGEGLKNQVRAEKWIENFEEVSSRHTDSQGRKFQYTWFYPIDRFDSVIVKNLASSSSRGFGEIEVHWHHHHDTGTQFRSELQTALKGFTDVGALIDKQGAQPKFAFIHGNWTLDNSGPDRLCGVNDEIQILLDAGCYADLTFPALGTSAQPRMFNQIFYSQDTPDAKSYDLNATPAVVGKLGAGLMMIPGPLGLNFKNPRILMEYACLDDAEGSGLSGKLFGPSEAKDYFKDHRVDFWNKMAIGVEGKPEWVFVKIHAHGMLHESLFFEGELEAMLSGIEEYCEQKNIKLHYVTAREAYNLARAAEAGTTESPELLYDYLIPPPMTRTEPSF